MQPRIERRRARCGPWLLYPLIAVSACALAGLVSAAPPGCGAIDPPVHAIAHDARRGT